MFAADAGRRCPRPSGRSRRLTRRTPTTTFAARRGEADRVGDQVAQRLADRGRPSTTAGAGPVTSAVTVTRPSRRRAVGGDHLLSQLGQSPAVVGMEPEHSRRRRGPGPADRRPAVRADRPPPAASRPAPVEWNHAVLGGDQVALDVGERSPQLVRDVADHRLALVVVLLDRLRHRVERMPEPGHLVRARSPAPGSRGRRSSSAGPHRSGRGSAGPGGGRRAPSPGRRSAVRRARSPQSGAVLRRRRR